MSEYKEDRSNPSHHHRRRLTRSRSPETRLETTYFPSKHRRRHGDGRHKHITSNSSARTPPPVYLPFGAQPINKHDLETFRPLFATYLEIQKRLALEDLEEEEAKGRWKSFVSKWNRGDLAEGWYDPSRLSMATMNAPKASGRNEGQESVGQAGGQTSGQTPNNSDEDDFGPSLPQALRRQELASGGAGPTVPSMQDLEFQRELAQEEADNTRATLRKERIAHNAVEEQRLEELAPKAEAGTKERQLEKKRELASANRAFAATKEGGGMTELADRDIMGGDEDDLTSFKRRKVEQERQKSERELRREEVSRAKREEREQRQREFREREDRTMQGFIELARRKFG